MRKNLFFTPLLALFLLAATTALAGQTVDAPHTSVVFKTRHIVAPVWGRFNDFASEVDFDPRTPAKGTLTFSLAVDSIDTGVSLRDYHLMSPFFFDVMKHPKITFVSEAVRRGREGGDTFLAEGRLTMKGVTRDFVVPFRVLGIEDHPQQECVEVMGVSAAFAVNRLDFRVGDGSWVEKSMLSETVQVFIDAEVLRDEPGCAK